jgi:hypothetical protein
LARSWSESRLARGLLFLAVVWSVAGAFVGLHLGAPNLLHLLVREGWIDAQRVMPDYAEVRTAKACPSDEAAGAADTAMADPVERRQVRYAIWRLGQEFGFAAAMAASGTRIEELAPFFQEVRSIAAALALPAPTLPTTWRPSSAASEFVLHLETDPDCVVGRLTARFGADQADLYKLSVLIGYATPYAAAGAGGIVTPYLLLYGPRAGVPEHLWSPLMRDALPGETGAGSADQAMAIVDRLDDYLRSAP